MSLGRRTTNYRGYLTETTFDAARDEFVETALALAPAIAAPQPEPDGPIHRVLRETEARLRVAHANHLGYPYNLVGRSPVPPDFGDYLINNLGDPYAGSHYASEVCGIEREAVAWLMDLWECETPADYWGSVGASGTEGNLWALYLAREAFPTARLIYSREAHYSIPKAARILRIETTPIDCTPDGAIDLDALATALEGHRGEPAIVALTCGTTVRGAHDDIGGVLGRLDASGVGAERRFVHVDGALNAMVLPFVDDAPAALRPSFRHAIDSISTSGHKMIGTAMPCGVLVARRRHVDRVASAIAYLRSNDTTLMGSRNGHAALALWTRLHGHGIDGYRADVRGCLARTDRLAAALRTAAVPVLRNPLSLTVVFPQPPESIVGTYQLACHRGEAHAIVMPNVTDTLLDRFLADYLGWWRSAPRPAADGRGTAEPARGRCRA
jgi:histidine decarboxylase